MTLHAVNSLHLCGNCLRVAVKRGPSTLHSLIVVFLSFLLFFFLLFFFEDRRFKLSVTLCSCAPMGSIMMSQQGRTLSLPLPLPCLACLPPTAYYGALPHPTELAFSSTECSPQTYRLFIHRQPKLIPGHPKKKIEKLRHWMNLGSSLVEGWSHQPLLVPSVSISPTISRMELDGKFGAIRVWGVDHTTTSGIIN